MRSSCPLSGIKGDIRLGRKAGVGVGRLQGGVEGAGQAEIIDKDVKKKKQEQKTSAFVVTADGNDGCGGGGAHV